MSDQANTFQFEIYEDPADIIILLRRSGIAATAIKKLMIAGNIIDQRTMEQFVDMSIPTMASALKLILDNADYDVKKVADAIAEDIRDLERAGAIVPRAKPH